MHICVNVNVNKYAHTYNIYTYINIHMYTGVDRVLEGEHQQDIEDAVAQHDVLMHVCVNVNVNKYAHTYKYIYI